MESFTLAIDVFSVAAFLAVLLVGVHAMRNFRQSKLALIESASLVSVIVDALTSRIQQSESVVGALQTEMDVLKDRSAGMEWEQATLRTSHLQLLRCLQEILNNDKRLIAELEWLKRRVSMPETRRVEVEPPPLRAQSGGGVLQGDISAGLTPTEHATLGILLREGPKGAPELGKRLNKSREHTSRLMKKMYLEGYVDRESNRAPYRYRLSDIVRSALQSGEVTARPEKA